MEFRNLETHAEQQLAELVNIDPLEGVVPLPVGHRLGDDFGHEWAEGSTPILKAPREHVDDTRPLARLVWRPGLSDAGPLGSQGKRCAVVPTRRQERVQVLGKGSHGRAFGESQGHKCFLMR